MLLDQRACPVHGQRPTALIDADGRYRCDATGSYRRPCCLPLETGEVGDNGVPGLPDRPDRRDIARASD